jgi:hypothetical protein
MELMERKMTDVIDFLERLGQDAALRRAPLESTLKGAELSAEVRVALSSRDQRSLEALLGTSNVCCMINAPVEEEQDEQHDKKDAQAA